MAKNHMRRILPYTSLLCIICFSTFAQTKTIDQIVSDYQQAQQSMPREKLYLATDKNIYAVGDTIYFSIFLTEALYLTPSDKSGIAYVELFDGNGALVSRMALHLANGNTTGDIAIPQAESNGEYKIVAFTNWMRNFGDALYFQKSLLVSGNKDKDLVTNTPLQWSQSGNKQNLHTTITAKDNFGKSISGKTYRFAVLNKKGKTIGDGELTTDAQGHTVLDLPLSKKEMENAAVLNIQNGDNIVSKVPIVNTDITGDVQFLPESGYLVAGIPTAIGIKAIGINGMSTNISGHIEDQNGNKVAELPVLELGLGKFKLLPLPGKKYFAVLNDGTRQALPEVQNSGTAIAVTQNKDSVHIHISATEDLFGKNFFLLGQAKTYTVLHAGIKITPDGFDYSIAKNAFPSGISSILLYDQGGQIRNQRAFFIQNDDLLDIQLQTDKKTYHANDSIHLNISTTTAAGQPKSSMIALSVTDGRQSGIDSRSDMNIYSYMLLQSDLKGNIEQPAYYFRPEKKELLDALLLTQGYVRYDWNTAQIKYHPEPDFQISGKVTNVANKGIANANVTAMTAINQKQIVRTSVTDQNGNFIITNFPYFDSTRFVVDARRNNNSTFGIGMTLDRLTWPNYDSLSPAPFMYTPAVDSNISDRLAFRKQYNDSYKKVKGVDLEEVVVKYIGIPSSFNLNGFGKADEVVTPQTIRQYYDKNLYELLTATVPNFRLGTVRVGGSPNINQRNTQARFIQTFQINKNRTVRFLIDGQIPQYINEGGGAGAEAIPLLNYLKSIDASEIRGIEVLSSKNYTLNYYQKYLNGDIRAEIARGNLPEIDFIEITTYAGAGSYNKTNPGVEYINPTPFYLGKAFYAPKYKTTEDLRNKTLPDFRSTIYWDGRIVTGKDGKASVTFYAADLPTDYQIRAEGMNLQGNIGVNYNELKIEK